MAEKTDTKTETASSGDVLFQHPTWTDQILSVPADKAEEFEAAGYKKVSGEENAAKAVPAGRADRLHFTT